MPKFAGLLASKNVPLAAICGSLLAACGSADNTDANQEAQFNPALLTLSSVAGAVTEVNPIAAVSDLDIDRWLGRWYQTARIPAWFDTFCVGGTIAEYGLDATGDVTVHNSCVDRNGDVQEQFGLAKIADADKPGQLTVAFFGLDPAQFGANYWVLYRSDDYSFAIVGEPELEYGWVLSRTPTVTQSQIDLAAVVLSSFGYDVLDFELEDQSYNIAAEE